MKFIKTKDKSTFNIVKYYLFNCYMFYILSNREAGKYYVLYMGFIFITKDEQHMHLLLNKFNSFSQSRIYRRIIKNGI